VNYPTCCTLLRAYLAIRALLLVVGLLADPTNLARRAVDTNGLIGWVAITVLGAVALVALFDVLVNDLCPDRFVLPSFIRHRHLVYMALALGSMSMCLVAYRGGAQSLVPYLWTDAFFAAAVAIVDLLARHHRDQRQGDRRTAERRDHDRRSLV
jgi:hypothetical protein